MVSTPDVGPDIINAGVVVDAVVAVGLLSVGVLAKTSDPVPVSSVTAAARLALVGVPRNVAIPVPSEVNPVPPELAARGVPVNVIPAAVRDASALLALFRN